MANKLMRLAALLYTLAACSGPVSCPENDHCSAGKSNIQTKVMENNKVQARNGLSHVSCRHSPADLSRRKQTVLASLKKQTLEKRTLANGYAWRFAGTDKVATMRPVDQNSISAGQEVVASRGKFSHLSILKAIRL